MLPADPQLALTCDMAGSGKQGGKDRHVHPRGCSEVCGSCVPSTTTNPSAELAGTVVLTTLTVAAQELGSRLRGCTPQAVSAAWGAPHTPCRAA